MPKGDGNRGKGKGIAFLRAHVEHQGDECLIWPFAKDPHGYGMFGFNGVTLRSHRWMCEAINGPPTATENWAAHSCGNGHLGCVHPKHLSWKNPQGNSDDAKLHGTTRIGKGRSKRKLTPEQVAEIVALKGIKAGRDLAPVYGVHPRHITAIQHGRSWCEGRRYERAFTHEEIIQIRGTHGVPARVVAAEYGVKANVIYKIRLGLTYRYIPS